MQLHQAYLSDLGYLLRERALEAKQQARTARGKAEEVFELGRLTAYYEVISLLINQALAFQMPVDDLHLEGLNPDRDLLGTN